MASSTSLWPDDEAVNHWTRVGELGMEEALRQIGCSKSRIIEILEIAQRETFDLSDLDDENELMVRSTILATVGRGFGTTRWYIDSDLLTENDAIALCVNISSNTNVKVLYIGTARMFCTIEGFTLFGSALASNSTLRELRLHPLVVEIDSWRFLMDGLRSNKTLKTLILNIEPLPVAGVKFVAEFITNNLTLKILDLRFNCDYKAAELLSSALSRNSTLEDLILDIEHIERDAVAKLLQPFSGQAGDDTTSSSELKNSTIKNFAVSSKPGTESEYLDSLVEMIRTNRTLFLLRLKIDLTPQDWKKQIFPALKESNETLKKLYLSDCKGLGGEDVFETLMDVLQNNDSKTRLEAIAIGRTDVEAKQGQVNEELRINREYRYALRSQMSEPTTFGRLVMCGIQYAGKTTICEALKRIDHCTKGDHPLRTRWRKAMRAFPALRLFLFGEDAYLEIEKRTRGCDILVVHNQHHLKTIWDFAGQREYYALHDYLFPEMKNSCFLYVCSCRTVPTKEIPEGTIKVENDMREECEYWLKFIASNSKPYYVRHGEGRLLPRVIFVLTQSDTVGDEEARISQGWAKTVVRELKGKFKGVVDLCDEVEVCNALRQDDVIPLLGVVNDQLDKILKHQTEFNLCRDIRDIFSRWSSENPSKPVLDLEEFNKLCRERFYSDDEVPAGSEEQWKVVLSYFNDVGEIIFRKGLSFIVTNPRWFGVGILGYLIDAFKAVQGKSGGMLCCALPRAVDQDRTGVHPDQGVVDRTRMEVLLENSLEVMHLEQCVNSEQLIELMTKLEMCFKHGDSQLFLPALFDDEEESAANGERQLAWKIPLGRSPTYLGRRLQIENEFTTFLSPGFFPRFQVHLRNYVHKKGWTKNPAFTVARNLIQFAGEGVEVCVEYSGGTDYFVDILLRSQRPYEECLKFIGHHVVATIWQFCASPQGCQGVTLVEAVIRPGCVVGPQVCKYRKGHSVLVSKLEEKQAIENGYIHTWSQALEGVPIYDFALDLLKGKGAYKRPITNEMAPKPEDPTSSGSKSLPEVELPKHFYPSIDDVKILSKLNASLNVSKVLPIKLHILCDYTDAPHKVTGQRGRKFHLNWKNSAYQLSIAKVAVSLLWTAVGVGSTAAGVPQVAFSHLDRWIENLFTIGEMPALDAETLHRMNNPGKALEKVSEGEILKALAKYWSIDPHTEDLSYFLNLKDSPAFIKDFQLHKVVYLEEPYRIGWVCDKHYHEGLEQGILRSRPYSGGSL